jgi:hypothetical protein
MKTATYSLKCHLKALGALFRKSCFFAIIAFAIPSMVLGQQGPGGVTVELDFWIKADQGVYENSAGNNEAENNDDVQFWEDLSGNNQDLTVIPGSNNGSNPPEYLEGGGPNGVGAIEFDGSNEALQYTLSSNKTEPQYTIVMVFRYASSSPNNFEPIIATESKPNTNNSINPETIQYGASGNTAGMTADFFSVQGNGGTGNNVQFDTIANYASFHMVTVERNDNATIPQFDLYRDGSLVTSGTPGDTSIGKQFNLFRLGVNKHQLLF